MCGNPLSPRVRASGTGDCRGSRWFQGRSCCRRPPAGCLADVPTAQEACNRQLRQRDLRSTIVLATRVPFCLPGRPRYRIHSPPCDGHSEVAFSKPRVSDFQAESVTFNTPRRESSNERTVGGRASTAAKDVDESSAQVRFFPASERFFRQLPSLFRDRGCVPPPSSGTYGPLPALLSAITLTPFQDQLVSTWTLYLRYS